MEIIDNRIQFGFAVSIKDRLYSLYSKECEHIFKMYYIGTPLVFPTFSKTSL